MNLLTWTFRTSNKKQQQTIRIKIMCFLSVDMKYDNLMNVSIDNKKYFVRKLFISTIVNNSIALIEQET